MRALILVLLFVSCASNDVVPGCMPHSKGECVARVTHALGKPAFVDPEVDFNNDGVISGLDWVFCRELEET